MSAPRGELTNKYFVNWNTLLGHTEAHCYLKRNTLFDRMEGDLIVGSVCDVLFPRNEWLGTQGNILDGARVLVILFYYCSKQLDNVSMQGGCLIH